MQQREILRMGCRLLGVYCLILAIPQLANVVWWPALKAAYGNLTAVDAFLVRIAALVRPVLYAVVGAHLLLGGQMVQRLASREGVLPPVEENSEGLFAVLMQLLGAYFVATDLPVLLGEIVGMMMGIPSRYYSASARSPRIGWDSVVNLLPTAVELAFGFYLLAGGAIFRQLAFPPVEPAAGNAQTDAPGSSDR